MTRTIEYDNPIIIVLLSHNYVIMLHKYFHQETIDFGGIWLEVLGGSTSPLISLISVHCYYMFLQYKFKPDNFFVTHSLVYVCMYVLEF